MSDFRSSLSVTYFDPETVDVPEPKSDPETPKPAPKKRGRPKGSTNKKKRKKLPVFTVWRVVFWGAVSVLVVVSMYHGVQGWLGQSAAYLTLAATTLASAFLLDRDWKKIRDKK